MSSQPHLWPLWTLIRSEQQQWEYVPLCIMIMWYDDFLQRTVKLTVLIFIQYICDNRTSVGLVHHMQGMLQSMILKYQVVSSCILPFEVHFVWYAYYELPRFVWCSKKAVLNCHRLLVDNYQHLIIRSHHDFLAGVNISHHRQYHHCQCIFTIDTITIHPISPCAPCRQLPTPHPQTSSRF